MKSFNGGCVSSLVQLCRRHTSLNSATQRSRSGAARPLFRCQAFKLWNPFKWTRGCLLAKGDQWSITLTNNWHSNPSNGLTRGTGGSALRVIPHPSPYLFHSLFDLKRAFAGCLCSVSSVELLRSCSKLWSCRGKTDIAPYNIPGLISSSEVSERKEKGGHAEVE